MNIDTIITDLQNVISRQLAPFIRLEESLRSAHDLQGSVNILEKKREELQGKVDELDSFLQAKYDAHDKELAKLRRETSEECEKNRGAADAQLAEYRQSEMNKIEELRKEGIAEIEKIQTEQKKAEALVQQLKDEAEQLKANYANLEHGLTVSFNRQKERVEAVLANLQKKQDAVKEEVSNLEQRKEQVEAQYKSLQDMLKALKQQLTKV